MPPTLLGVGINVTKTAGYTVPVVTLLDQVSATAGAAYSTRKLRNAYTGPAIRVRRSTDNVEQDIGFNGSGGLDTTALTTFIGANSGFVATWYDQTTNARHVTNATASQQPRIVNAGTLEVQNGKPSLYFDNALSSRLTNSSPFMYAAGAASSFVVGRFASQSVRTLWAERNSGSGAAIYRLEIEGTDIRARMRNDASTTIPGLTPGNVNIGDADNTLRVFSFRDTGSQTQGFTNGGLENTISYTRQNPLTVNIFGLGANPTEWFIEGTTGFISEAIFFASSVSNADLNAINASQGGEYGISVTPFLTDVERLGIINGPADNGPSMGINFSQISDWEEPVFIDRAKQARGWERPGGGATPAINLNSEGALASLPGGDTTQNYFFSSFRDGGGVLVGTQPDRGGRFRATITGGASAMTGFGISNITQINPTTWEFNCDWVGNKHLTFTPTAFPIKVSIVRTDLVSAHAGGAIFDPDWLADLPSNGCIRFMDWMLTNNSTVVSLGDYPVEASQRWRRAPLSVMVALCNAKNLDPWICIPQAADDTLITNWATYLRDNLNTARKIRVEYSNEIWNTGMFSVGLYLKGQAETVWGVPDGYGGGGFWLDYGGKKFAQVMAIFNSVFTGQTSRLIGVIGGQAANPTFSTRILNASAWQTYEPGAYVAPHTRAKEFAIADYVGWLDGTAGTAQGNRIKAALDISHAAAVQAMKNEFPAGLALTKNYIATSVALAATRNLRLVSYEYGNHFDLNTPAIVSSSLWSGGNPVPGALNALVEATYSQEMADVMDDLRDFFKAQAGTLKCQYLYMSRGGVSGTWGARTHRGHNSAIWNALLAWWAANPRDWTQ